MIARSDLKKKQDRLKLRFHLLIARIYFVTKPEWGAVRFRTGLFCTVDRMFLHRAFPLRAFRLHNIKN